MGSAMTYRVEYNGEDIELATLDGALDSAKNAIAADVGPVNGWSVEHDETINDWFVRGTLNGSPFGPTAVVSGPEPIAPAAPSGRVYSSGDVDDWARRVTFAGATAAEAFDRAAGWLAARPEVVTLADVSWQAGELRLYYR
jgi:hypothetical protein